MSPKYLVIVSANIFLNDFEKIPSYFWKDLFSNTIAVSLYAFTVLPKNISCLWILIT